MNKETNAKLNDLAKRTRDVLHELTALDREADLFDIFPREIIEQEIFLEQALEALHQMLKKKPFSQEYGIIWDFLHQDD